MPEISPGSLGPWAPHLTGNLTTSHEGRKPHGKAYAPNSSQETSQQTSQLTSQDFLEHTASVFVGCSLGVPGSRPSALNRPTNSHGCSTCESDTTISAWCEPSGVDLNCEEYFQQTLSIFSAKQRLLGSCSRKVCNRSAGFCSLH